jgi:hypothetical protein
MNSIFLQGNADKNVHELEKAKHAKKELESQSSELQLILHEAEKSHGENRYVVSI